jgi:hypothetical protein
MEETSVLEAVVGVEDRGDAADAVLQLADGTRCTLDRQDRRLPIWRRLLDGARRTGTPVYVACAAGGGPAAVILPAAARRIARVGPEADGGRVPVAVDMSASAHHLSGRRAGHAQLRALLEQVAGRDEPLLLAVDPATLEIVAARRPPQGLKLVVI